MSKRKTTARRGGHAPVTHPGAEILALDEHQLRLNVVLPLLRAMDTIDGVNDVHGKNEKGLDVIFRERGKVRTTQYGMQLKAEPISGGGGASGTVQNILNQLGIAQSVSHPVAIDGAGTVRVEQFLVATNKSISETARLEIAARIAPTTVDFWDGNKLVQLVREYIPELLGHANAALVAYLKPLIQKLDRLDSMDQIQGVANKRLSQVYEEPHLRRLFDTALGKEQNAERAGAFPALLLPLREARSVVIAEQDAGKTALLRMIAIKTARLILDGSYPHDKEPLPVLIQSRDLIEKHDGDILACVHSAIFKESQAWKEDIASRAKNGSLLLLIDGFSETLTDEKKVAAERAIVTFGESYPEARLVIAARQADFLKPRFFLNFRHHVLQDFTATQVGNLLQRWTSEAPIQGDVARMLVARIHEALQLPGSPISATIGVMLYEREQRFITNTAEIVDRYMVIRLGRYAQELGMKQEVDWAKKQDLLAEIAYDMLSRDEVFVGADDMTARFDVLFDRFGEERKGRIVLEELIESGILYLEDGEVSFFRVGFRDFFAAKAIEQHKDRDDVVLERFLERRWGLAHAFAAGLRRKNNELLTELAKLVAREKAKCVGDPSPDYLFASYLSGRILSNSETSNKDPRLKILRACLQASADSLPSFTREAVAQLGNIGELSALIGLDYTFSATVGVPWLAKLFAEVASDKTISDEQRYLVAATYVHLALTDYSRLLSDVVGSVKDTRVLVAMSVLIRSVLKERELTPEVRAEIGDTLKSINRRLAKPVRRAAIRKLFKYKSRIVELEVRRLKGLTGQQHRPLRPTTEVPIPDALRKRQ